MSLVAIGYAGGTTWATKDTVTLSVGETAHVQGYSLTYKGAAWEEQPHRKSLAATYAVAKGDGAARELAPRLNHYKTMNQPIGTPQVWSGLDEDLYLNLVRVDEASGTATIEALVKPLVWWLWAGGGVMAFGTLLAAWPARRRKDAA